MVIIKLNGGLGNQMFQYAFGQRLSLVESCDVYYDLSSIGRDKKRQYELKKVFGLDLKKASRLYTYSSSLITRKPLRHIMGFMPLNNPFANIIVEKDINYNSQYLRKVDKDAYIIGFWQSYKYFRDVERIIKNSFVFKNQNRVPASIKHSLKTTNSVGIHVRRGDYINDDSVNKIHGLDLGQYYSKAIGFIEKNIRNPHYYVFSDDISWCKKNFKPRKQITYMDTNRGSYHYLDMYLMTKLKALICANSSFSWWGGYMNERTGSLIVAPSQWFRNKNIKATDRYPKSWKVIKV